MEIEVGRVWELDNQLVMVSYLESRTGVAIGKAAKRGSTYAIVGTPTLIKKTDLRRGKFVFDTEGV